MVTRDKTIDHGQVEEWPNINIAILVDNYREQQRNNIRPAEQLARLDVAAAPIQITISIANLIISCHGAVL